MRPAQDSDPRLRVAMVLSDLREDHGLYGLSTPRFGSAPTALLKGMEQHTDVEVHVISCVRRHLESPRQLASNVFYHSCTVPWWGWLKMLYIPCILKVRETVRRISPAVVHGQGTERYCSLAAVFANRPSVLTVHGNMRAVARAFRSKPWSFHGITAILEAKTLPLASGVICLNEYTRNQVYTLASSMWKIPNAVGNEFFEVPRSPNSTPILFCPAIIALHKNQNALIKALDVLASDHRFVLRFAGAMPETPYSREFRDLISSRSWCEYVGVLEGDALKDAYAQAAMLILASTEDNCPMAILEAMAMGIPIAGARVGGIPELLDHGVEGVLFDPACPEQTAGVIRECLRNPSSLEKMGLAAKRRANKCHRPQIIAAHHIAVYRELLTVPANCGTVQTGVS